MQGDMAQGFAFAGANAWRVDRILTVQELLDSLVEEYHASAAAEVSQDDLAEPLVSE
jgi:nitronate monooxygenase